MAFVTIPFQLAALALNEYLSAPSSTPSLDFSQSGNSQYIPLLARPSSYTPFQAHYDRIARRTAKETSK